MTTPAQDAPLVFPSVAFRPLRLFAICVVLAGLATALGAASTIFFDPRYTGAVMLAAILGAIVVTLIPLLRRRDDHFDEMYDKK